MENNFYKIWTRLGVSFDEKISHNSMVDLEAVLVETAQQGREDSRLLFGLRGWLLKHHDLVNGARLIRKIKSTNDTAVLGAILESVVSESPRSNLQYVIKYCQASQKMEFVFHKVEESKALSELNRHENLSVWKKWNLISREMGDMQGAIMDKKYVLKHNPQLALRALFGPGLKAEILSYFMLHQQGNARQIAQTTGFSYQPVHSELNLFFRIGLVKEKQSGKARLFSLNTSFLTKILSPSF